MPITDQEKTILSLRTKVCRMARRYRLRRRLAAWDGEITHQTQKEHYHARDAG